MIVNSQTNYTIFNFNKNEKFDKKDISANGQSNKFTTEITSKDTKETKDTKDINANKSPFISFKNNFDKQSDHDTEHEYEGYESAAESLILDRKILDTDINKTYKIILEVFII